MYSWLNELDKELTLKGKLPSTIYHQFDGGPENSKTVPLVIAELLIYRGLTDKVVLTRLPVGHTHEVRGD